MNQMTPTELKEAIESTYKLLMEEHTNNNDVIRQMLFQHFEKLVEQQKAYAGYM